MELAGLALTAGILALIGGVLYLANLAAVDGRHEPALRRLLFGLNGAGVLFAALTLTALLLPSDLGGSLAPGAALFGLALALGMGLFNALLLARPGFRSGLRRVLGPAYDPASPLHLTALVLSTSLLSYTVTSLIASGGVQALADSISATGVSTGETLFQNLLWVLAALLGVGLFIRRTPAQAARRLGFQPPRLSDLVVGGGVGLLLYGVVFSISLLSALLLTPEQLTEQTAVSAALLGSVNTLGGALLLSLPVAIGEEVFFRGALQPVLGLLPTSLFFAALHAQYGFTPALLAIFLVGLLLGVLAQRRGTLAAITGHFVFNFVQLALVVLASGLLSGGTGT
jgi:membrane protease YdiL (CAAX protease family)